MRISSYIHKTTRSSLPAGSRGEQRRVLGQQRSPRGASDCWAQAVEPSANEPQISRSTSTGNIAARLIFSPFPT